jgi:hypothetical protein
MAEGAVRVGRLAVPPPAVAPVSQELVVEVRLCGSGVACRPHITEDIARAYELALGEAGKIAIEVSVVVDELASQVQYIDGASAKTVGANLPHSTRIGA